MSPEEWLAQQNSKTAMSPEEWLASQKSPGFNDRGGLLHNLVGGFLRGSGSIGATILAPVDAAARALNGGKPVSVGGYDILGQDRRTAMDEGLRSAGVDTDSLAFKGGKIGAEVAGTAGAGGVVAKGMTATASSLANLAPQVAQYAPQIAKGIPALSEALTKFAPVVQSGGMTVGNAGTGSALGNAAVRSAGGAVNGAVTAGLVNPEDAGTGAVVGAVAPNVIKVAGEIGKAAGAKASGKYAEALAKYNREAPKRATIAEAVDAGYVIPPNMANPSAKNRIIESFAGKDAVSQLVSVKNQDTTEKLVRQALGLADDAPLTKTALEQIRKVEGGAYKKVADLSPQAEIDLEALKQARNEAQGWFNAYNRSASPADLAKAKEARDLAEVLELQLESHAKNAGKEELIPALREARKQIAKTYTVERALNDATGTVNARVIGRMHEKGKPLSDGLDVVGRFASGFPKAANAPQQMGSPGAHKLQSALATALGGGGFATMGPAGLVGAAIPYATSEAAKALVFRKGAQQALANQAAPTISNAQKLAQILQDPEMQMLLARSAPVALTSSHQGQ